MSTAPPFIPCDQRIVIPCNQFIPSDQQRTPRASLQRRFQPTPDAPRPQFRMQFPKHITTIQSTNVRIPPFFNELTNIRETKLHARFLQSVSFTTSDKVGGRKVRPTRERRSQREGDTADEGGTADERVNGEPRRGAKLCAHSHACALKFL